MSNHRNSTTAPAISTVETNLDIADLETPLADATRMASITSRLITDCIGRPNTGNKYHLTNNQVEDMLFATYQTADLIKRIYEKWELILDGGERRKVSDPIIAAIAAYHNGRQQFNDTPDSASDEDFNHLWRVPWDVLSKWDRPCTSRAGATEAIKLAIFEEEIGDSELTATMMRAALAYLEGASE
ncbi:hypothetical protein [Rhizobium sp.]|uniref:hypothetical protein n=1 Tax=Rhizobium sp. TaxID=391 RepID=UPI0028ACFD9E